MFSGKVDKGYPFVLEMKKLRHKKLIKLPEGHVVPEVGLEPSSPDSTSRVS